MSQQWFWLRFFRAEKQLYWTGECVRFLLLSLWGPDVVCVWEGSGWDTWAENTGVEAHLKDDVID